MSSLPSSTSRFVPELTTTRAFAPVFPPAAPHGLNTNRSIPRPSTALPCWATRTLNTTPVPPRQRPGPPESVRSAYSVMIASASSSVFSMGVLRWLARLESRPSTPSAPWRAPVPPTSDWSTITLRAPPPSCSTSTEGIMMPPLGAGMSSGSARVIAPHDGFVETDGGRAPDPDRGRRLRVDDGSERRLHRHVVEHAVVERNGLVVAEDVVHELQGKPRMALAPGRDVVGRFHLRIRTGEVEVHLAVARGHRAAHANGNVGVEVVVQEVPELPGSVGDIPLHGERLVGRVLREVALRLQERLRPVDGDELADPPLADPEGGQHGLDVAKVLLRHPAVRAVQGEEVPVHLPRPDELQGRDLEPLLVELGETRRDAGRHRPADVGGVNEVPAVGNDAPVLEHRLDEVEIRHVGGEPLAVVGVVGDHHVTGLQILDALEGGAHVAVEEPRDAEVGRIGEEPARRSRDGGSEVARLLDVGRARRALQGDRHLLGDGGELVEEDLHRDGIELHAACVSLSPGAVPAVAAGGSWEALAR